MGLTQEELNCKLISLAKMRKKYKFHVIHDDSATKINLIKEVINKLENEIKAHDTKR